MNTQTLNAARYASLIVALTLTGCSGKLYSVYSDQPAGGSNAKVEGVYVMGARVIHKKVKRDRIIHPISGEITHFEHAADSDERCQPIVVTVPVVASDPTTGYYLVYEPALFETSTFSVTLENGRLKSVNTTSTPGTKTAVEALQAIVDVAEDVFAAEVGGGAAAGRIRCSHGEAPAG